MNNDTVKLNLKKIRKAAGITQIDMAERIGVSKTSYNNLESGETRLISERLEQIAEVLDISPEQIVLGYKPVEADAMKVKDIQAENDEKIKKLKASHEEDIKQLRQQIASLEHIIAAMQETIATQKDIIAIMKKKENSVE